MSDVNDSVKAALEAAASESEESSTEETAESTEETTEESSEEAESKADEKSEAKGKNAQSRIRDLVSQSKELQEELDTLKGTVTERDTEIGKLVDLIEARENDSRIIQKINELHEDPEWKPIIEDLDKAVRGLPVERSSDKSDESDDKIDSKALKVLEDTQAVLQDRILDQQAEILLGKADVLADRYIDELPEEYNEDDRRLLRGHLTELIDWDAIEENPDDLPEIFAQGFQATLDYYGQPKGFVPESKSDDTDDSESRQVSDEDLVEKDWGKMREVKAHDGTVIKEPAVSDEDFQAVLAEAIRRSRG